MSDETQGKRGPAATPNPRFINGWASAPEMASETLSALKHITRNGELRDYDDELANRVEDAKYMVERFPALHAALAVPTVWSEDERDGMAAAFAEASKKHGHYESLFAAASWLLRHRQTQAGFHAQMEAQRDHALRQG